LHFKKASGNHPAKLKQRNAKVAGKSLTAHEQGDTRLLVRMAEI